MTDGLAESDPHTWLLLHEQHRPGLVAYAQALTGDLGLAQDLVAEAHFRLWRRSRDGHAIGDVPAELTETLWNLAATCGGPGSGATPRGSGHDLGSTERVTGKAVQPLPVSHVDVLLRVFDQLPQRWLAALWLAEGEGLEPDAIGRRMGSSSQATVLLLDRARAGLREAFLRAVQPGTPANRACEVYGDRLPAWLRGVDERPGVGLERHLADCPDCRVRMATLTRADRRLPLMTGPALLDLLAEGKTFLPPAGPDTRKSGAHAAPARISVRRFGFGRFSHTGPLTAATAGLGVLVLAGAAVATGLTLTGGEQSATSEQQRHRPAAASAPAEPGATPHGSQQARSDRSSSRSERRRTSPPQHTAAPRASEAPTAPKTATSPTVTRSTPAPAASTDTVATPADPATTRVTTPEPATSQPTPVPGSPTTTASGTASTPTPEATDPTNVPEPTPSPSTSSPTATPTPTSSTAITDPATPTPAE